MLFPVILIAASFEKAILMSVDCKVNVKEQIVGRVCGIAAFVDSAKVNRFCWTQLLS
jgi:hypothetical protein